MVVVPQWSSRLALRPCWSRRSIEGPPIGLTVTSPPKCCPAMCMGPCLAMTAVVMEVSPLTTLCYCVQCVAVRL
ncbi:hypothetical protein MHYP_G00040520 [Metynnis hypsauchen]